MKKKPRKSLKKSTRDVLFAPWRHSYVKRTQKEADGCVFCDAIRGGVSEKTLVVFKGKTASIILNKFPYSNGHVMVIPNRHTAEFVKLSEAEFTELHFLLKTALSVLQTAYTAQGFNVGMNLGRAAGAGIVDHLHYHLVPRWVGDTNFMPIVADTKVISESLEETYKKLVSLFI